MTNQRIRNLTTQRLHTEIGHIYEDIEFITGDKGIMTHMLGNAVTAMEDWLRRNVTDPRFYDGAFDTTHAGETALNPMTDEERGAFLKAFSALPSPLRR